MNFRRICVRSRAYAHAQITINKTPHTNAKEGNLLHLLGIGKLCILSIACRVPYVQSDHNHHQESQGFKCSQIFRLSLNHSSHKDCQHEVALAQRPQLPAHQGGEGGLPVENRGQI